MRRGWIDASVRCQLPAFSSTTTPHRLPGTTADAHTGVSCSPSTPADLRASLRVSFRFSRATACSPTRVGSSLLRTTSTSSCKQKHRALTRSTATTDDGDFSGSIAAHEAIARSVSTPTRANSSPRTRTWSCGRFPYDLKSQRSMADALCAREPQTCANTRWTASRPDSSTMTTFSSGRSPSLGQFRRFLPSLRVSARLRDLLVPISEQQRY